MRRPSFPHLLTSCQLRKTEAMLWPHFHHHALVLSHFSPAPWHWSLSTVVGRGRGRPLIYFQSFWWANVVMTLLCADLGRGWARFSQGSLLLVQVLDSTKLRRVFLLGTGKGFFATIGQQLSDYIYIYHYIDHYNYRYESGCSAVWFCLQIQISSKPKWLWAWSNQKSRDCRLVSTSRTAAT